MRDTTIYEPNYMTSERRESFIQLRIKEYGITHNNVRKSYGRVCCLTCCKGFSKHHPSQKYCDSACGSTRNINRLKLKRMEA